jgi:CRISPR/Cas system endoribonuclease Cas6 (RAMP superfamily)
MGVLADELAPALVDLLYAEPEIRLGTASYQLELPAVIEAPKSFAELLGDPPSRPMGVTFESPMAFHYQPLDGAQSPWSYRLLRAVFGPAAEEVFADKRRGGSRDPRKVLPWPDPDRCFFHWFSKWKMYSDVELRDDLPRWVNRHVGVGAHEGRAVRLELKEDGREGQGYVRPFIGYVGRVEFSLLRAKDVPDDVKRQIWALARFATYSGTGVDTLRGMGQTLGPV